MDAVEHRARARAAEHVQPDQPDAEPRAGAVAEQVDARGLLPAQCALFEQRGRGRRADRIAAGQAEQDRARRRGRQAVQPGERSREQAAEGFRKAGPHEQPAGEEKRDERGQRPAGGKGEAVAHPFRAGRGAEQEGGKQRER